MKQKYSDSKMVFSPTFRQKRMSITDKDIPKMPPELDESVKQLLEDESMSKQTSSSGSGENMFIVK